MATETASKAINKQYFIVVTLLTFVLPFVCALVETMTDKNTSFSLALFSKWFIFSAVGLRLFMAGIRQCGNPAFTAKEIFNIQNPESYPIVRELGFANLCFGLIGIVSLFMPQWRVVSAFGSGLYYGMAGALHVVKKPVGANETFALVTDLIIFAVLVVCFVAML